MCPFIWWAVSCFTSATSIENTSRFSSSRRCVFSLERLRQSAERQSDAGRNRRGQIWPFIASFSQNTNMKFGHYFIFLFFYVVHFFLFFFFFFFFFFLFFSFFFLFFSFFSFFSFFFFSFFLWAPGLFYFFSYPFITPSYFAASSLGHCWKTFQSALPPPLCPRFRPLWVVLRCFGGAFSALVVGGLGGLGLEILSVLPMRRATRQWSALQSFSRPSALKCCNAEEVEPSIAGLAGVLRSFKCCSIIELTFPSIVLPNHLLLAWAKCLAAR